MNDDSSNVTAACAPKTPTYQSPTRLRASGERRRAQARSKKMAGPANSRRTSLHPRVTFVGGGLGKEDADSTREAVLRGEHGAWNACVRPPRLSRRRPLLQKQPRLSPLKFAVDQPRRLELEAQGTLRDEETVVAPSPMRGKRAQWLAGGGFAHGKVDVERKDFDSLAAAAHRRAVNGDLDPVIAGYGRQEGQRSLSHLALADGEEQERPGLGGGILREGPSGGR
eukprot:193381-Hanusia_phi.AAC.1